MIAINEGATISAVHKIAGMNKEVAFHTRRTNREGLSRRLVGAAVHSGSIERNLYGARVSIGRRQCRCARTQTEILIHATGPCQGIGPDVTLIFPLLSAVAVRVGQVTVIGEPESGWRVNEQVNVSRSPGVRDPSVVVKVIVYVQQSALTIVADVRLCAEAGTVQIASSTANPRTLKTFGA